MAFVKGQSGNPGGRRALPAWLKERGEDALLYIAKVASGEEQSDPRDRLKAAQYIADRAYGKAAQSVEVVGDPDAPLHNVIRVEFVKPDEPTE